MQHWSQRAGWSTARRHPPYRASEAHVGGRRGTGPQVGAGWGQLMSATGPTEAGICLLGPDRTPQVTATGRAPQGSPCSLRPFCVC